MAKDAQLLVRSAATDLTAALVGAYIAIPPLNGDAQLAIMVPTFAETGDKIVPTLTYSDDGTNAKEIVTLPDITYANVVTAGRTEYFYPLLQNRAYLKVDLAITDADSGSDFNAGKVSVAIVPAGRGLKH